MSFEKSKTEKMELGIYFKNKESQYGFLCEIYFGQVKIGEVEYEEDQNFRIISNINLLPEYRGGGLGKSVYRQLNEEARAKGKVLAAYGTMLTDDARHIWESFIKTGEAEKFEDKHFKFKE